MSNCKNFLPGAFAPPTSRRAFLGSTLAASGAFLAPRWLRGDEVPPSERLGLGFIGAGGMASQHMHWFRQQPDVRIAAVCDVDKRHLEDAQGIVGADCRYVDDFRKLLEMPGIDAVLIATPDHWHGLAAIAAAGAGKHIYCEKPLTNSVGEGRAVCEAVKKAGVVLQTGSHERSSPGSRIAKQLIGEGRFGEIKEVRIQLPMDEPHLQQVAQLTEVPAPVEVPAEFDYDFWLGHTPVVPYTEKRCHFWWRFHLAYGGGEMTDRGAHVIDLAQMILGLDDTGPVSFQAEGKASPSGFFDAFVQFKFENEYANGIRMLGDNQGPRGLRFVGTDGSLFVAVHGAALTSEPASLLDGVSVPAAVPYDSHRREFLEAVRHGTPVVAPAEAGHRTASICHLNNIALRLGRPFRWDTVAERANDEHVNALLMPTMRPPWSMDV